MNGTGALIKNENIKIWKQVSFRVIVIIFAVILLVIPFAGWLLNEIENSDYDYSYFLEYAEDMKENGEPAGYEYYRVLYDSSDFFYLNGYSSDDVRYFLYRDQYSDRLMCRAALELINDGTYTYRSLRDSGYGWSLCDSLQRFFFEKYPEKIAEYTDEEDGEMAYYFDPDITDELTPDVLAALKTDIDAAIAETEKEVLDFSITEYYREGLNDCTEQLAYLRGDLEIQKAALALAPSDSDLKIQVMTDELRIEGQEKYRDGLEHLMTNACEYGSWEYITVMDGISEAASSLVAPLADRDTFEKEGGFFSYDSYEDYERGVKNTWAAAREALAVYEYSLKHNVPLPEAYCVSSKADWQSWLSAMINVSAVICVVLAGTVLSQEYSTGSIRLLLIRPRRRSKILLSKLASIGIFWGMLVLASYVVLFLMSMLLNGVNDLFVSDLFFTGSRVIALPSFVSTLMYAAEDVITNSVFVLLALMLSVLVKKAALSIALPLIGVIFSGSVQTVSFLFKTLSGKRFIEFTPLPYFSFGAFRTGAAAYFIGRDNFSLSDLLFGSILDIDVMRDFIPLLGIAYMLLISAVEIYVSFRSFRRQQIMN